MSYFFGLALAPDWGNNCLAQPYACLLWVSRHDEQGVQKLLTWFDAMAVVVVREENVRRFAISSEFFRSRVY